MAMVSYESVSICCVVRAITFSALFFRDKGPLMAHIIQIVYPMWVRVE